MTPLILSSPLLNCRTTVYLNSFTLGELGTNLPRPSPGEILSFWRFADTGYPHDGRADKDSYPHGGRADKDSYPHDRHNQYIIGSLC